jgi:hypothetical protein
MVEQSPIFPKPLNKKLASRIQLIGANQKLEIFGKLSGGYDVDSF